MREITLQPQGVLTRKWLFWLVFWARLTPGVSSRGSRPRRRRWPRMLD